MNTHGPITQLQEPLAPIQFSLIYELCFHSLLPPQRVVLKQIPDTSFHQEVFQYTFLKDDDLKKSHKTILIPKKSEQ